jgi:enterochelin esterase-like enzyme
MHMLNTASPPLDWSLISGPLPVVVTAAGVAALAYLAVRRNRRWWVRTAVPVVIIAAIVTAGIVGFVQGVWRPFVDSLPPAVVGWIAVAVLGLAFAAVRVRRGPWWRPTAAVGCALVVLAMAAVQINVHFGQYPRVRNALGAKPVNMGALPGLTPVSTTQVSRAVGAGWTPPADLPVAGRIAEVTIPGRVSGFKARPARVYVPPAYLTARRPLLPVLILLAGQPGSPRDWFDGGRLDTVMNGFAARHRGLAPIIVIPDDLGATTANPLCIDSRLGKVETYLTQDVRDWIRGNLDVDRDPAHWAVAGYSHGGTCALQLAVRRPDVFATFIDVSGQQEPTLGDRARTVSAAFGGDKAAFAAVNPLDIMASRKFPHTYGFFAVGRDDGTYKKQQTTVVKACRDAGMTVETIELPGGHTWAVWGPGFARGLEAISTRLGLAS